MDTETPLDLPAIYAPILAEMRELGRFLKAEFSSPEPFILELLEHIARFRGKQIRPALLFLTGKLRGGVIGEGHVKIAGVVELIHTATLVHDDILDDARIRRRVETLHRRWGERAAVLMGDFLYSRAFHLSTEVPGMASVLSDTTHAICEGELLQTGNRHRVVDEATYFKIIEKKTAILYAVACEIGGVLSRLDAETCRKLRDFGMRLGMAFQIVDDCLDYAGGERVTGKSLGTDLHQGKMTLPLIYLMECVPDSTRRTLVDAVTGSLPSDTEAWIANLVREHGVIAEAFARAEEFVQGAKAVLAEIDGSGRVGTDLGAMGGVPKVATRPPAGLRESLELVADYVIRRQR